MELDDVERNWETFGRTDPLWAILTHADRKDNRWNIDDFFRTGEQWIAHLKEEIEASGVTLSSGRSLDFGCGVGRLTQALCKHFERCDGVDIADSMISLARRYNRYGERCKYHVNKSDNLGLFADDTFDFVYSLIVLQHLEPRFGKRYIAEFVRVLKPGGVVAFQIPSAYLGRTPRPFARLLRGLSSKVIRPLMEMYCIPPAEVFEVVAGAGAQMIRIFNDGACGPDYESCHYVVYKPR